jgi:hypothetical protein
MSLEFAPDHIFGFVLNCPQACFKTRFWEAGVRGSHADVMRAHLDARRCKRCGDKLVIEAIWADAEGRVPAGAPKVVPGPRQRRQGVGLWPF